MKFETLKLESVVGSITELPAEWMDETARELVDHLRIAVSHLRNLARMPTAADFQEMLTKDARFLDVCRLFLRKGQEPAGHMLCDALGGPRMTWSRLRGLGAKEPERMAAALVEIGLPGTIAGQLSVKWELEDLLIERYKMSRGRAIAAQNRGRALEDRVEDALQRAGVPFESRVAFVGKRGASAKCDFAVPARNHPKIVIESKGFEATGSKLTDFLGDVLKIGEAKEYHMYFLLVTDGRGWHNRLSDLQKLVDYQNEGLVDMIYTLSQLPRLAADVQRIFQNE